MYNVCTHTTEMILGSAPESINLIIIIILMLFSVKVSISDKHNSYLFLSILFTVLSGLLMFCKKNAMIMYHHLFRKVSYSKDSLCFRVHICSYFPGISIKLHIDSGYICEAPLLIYS